jgi:hypothetical protein
MYLRWWFNGWHYFNFSNRYEISMKTDTEDIQTIQFFSVISRIERATKINTEYSYQVRLEGIAPGMIDGFKGLLLAELVEQYESEVWREVDITRDSFTIREAGDNAYAVEFEIFRRELPNSAAVYQKKLLLYLGDTLCDLDYGEVIPINKQVNDIAEMQDRQSDFTASFKIRKTRAMKELFELSGDVGAVTNFPFEKQTCRLVQDGIEIISHGTLILERSEDQYYIVSILSGNHSFFKAIEPLKITDLTLASTDHTWDIATMAASHASDLDYVYPLLEPSDDAGLAPLTDDGSSVEMYGGWIWPFIKVRAIWNEIFVNAGYTAEGEILDNPIFNGLFMPISNRNTSITHDDYLKWIYGIPMAYLKHARNKLAPGDGGYADAEFIADGNYRTYFEGTYSFRVSVTLPLWKSFILQIYNTPPDNVWLRNESTATDVVMTRRDDLTTDFLFGRTFVYEGEIEADANELLSAFVSPAYIQQFYVNIVAIDIEGIGYGADVYPAQNLCEISQTNFIKMICNMFGLIPDVNARTRKIRFWNLAELYRNIGNARDWSEYLSEKDDEGEFKFGDYAQRNNLRYTPSDDVLPRTGLGHMYINDETLPFDKDMVEVCLSTCDHVIILTDIVVARIAFNTYNNKESVAVTGDVYDQAETIDGRIVYVSALSSKTLTLRDQYAPAGASTVDINNPKRATAVETSFANLVTNYSGLSRLLTKTNLRRAKFNLPVYEVAGLDHSIPVYVSQFKSYFYVNKISNYVPGKLTTVDLIKL